jgi:RNA polymerase sigma-70 factor (ECF subfamily)
MIEDDRNSQFSAVVLPHLPDALTTALWLTRDRADAEDVVQEACLRAFRAIATFTGGNARAWLLAIVRNTAHSWIQKNRRAELVRVDDLEPDERAQAERGADIEELTLVTPEADVIARADEAHLRVEIEKLPAEFRETLVLRDIQGLEYREIAEITSVPVGTVMSRLARARRRLVMALSQESGDHGRSRVQTLPVRSLKYARPAS